MREVYFSSFIDFSLKVAGLKFRFVFCLSDRIKESLNEIYLMTNV